MHFRVYPRVMNVITKTKDLEAFCERMAEADYITVDTEFMREKTYWPQLCLIQVAGPKEEAAIDPLSDKLKLDSLLHLMRDPSVLKVFHAARQDLEIFYQLMGEVPAPLYDTQVAAMVCGFGEQAGYETLVTKLTKGRIDKSSRFTDWSRRPLTNKQIKYAISDVTHLREVYDKLHAKLSQNDREAWVEEEMAVLTDSDTYEMRPEDAWNRVKKGRGVKPRMLAILQEVAAWREADAQSRNVPRQRILRDEAIVEISHSAPQTVHDLLRVRGMGKGLAEGRGGAAIIEAVARGLAVPDDQLPALPDRPRLPNNIGPVAEFLKMLLRVKCQANDVAAKLVASSADIDLLAADGEEADIPALHGWRYEMFGKDALKLMRGELALSLKGRKVHLAQISD